MNTTNIDYPIPFVKEMMEVTRNMWEMGWDERNGGNISYLIDEAAVKKYIKPVSSPRTLELPDNFSKLAGKYVLVTGTGKYFKNVIIDPEVNLGLIQISEDGASYDIVWGFEGDTKPTSELPAHLNGHIERLAVDPEHKIIMHCHATNTIAMTFVHDLDENNFTKTLWQMCSECLVVFPEGVGLVPWLVPGTNEIGKATSEKMKEFRIVVWPQHGIFGTGRDMDEAFGLIETVEKAAQIYMLINSHQGGIKQLITDDELRDLGKAFNVTPRAGIL